MKKWCFFFITFVFFMLITFGTYLYLYRAQFVSAVLTKSLGTQVKVEKLDITKDGVYIRKFVIMNPSTCSIPKAFSVNSIDILMQWETILATIFGGQGIVIDKIEIKQPFVSLEMFNVVGSDNNWNRILNNMPLNMQSKENRASSRTFLIKEVTLTKIELQARNDALGGISIKTPIIERISIKNLSNTPHTTDEIIQATLYALLKRFAKELSIPNLLNDIQGVGKDTLQTGEEVGEQILEAPSDLQSWFQQKTEETSQAIQSFLNGNSGGS